MADTKYDKSLKNNTHSGKTPITSVIKPQVEPKRVYSKSIDHPQDEFKLEVAGMIRDKAFLPNEKPRLETVEHCHFFYTVDRKGKKMTHCTATGGHKHAVTTSMDENGNLIGKSGPAIPHNGTVFIGPKNAKGIQVPHPKYEPDRHTHTVTYQKSAIVSKNRAKAKAEEIVAFAQKEADKKA